MPTLDQVKKDRTALRLSASLRRLRDIPRVSAPISAKGLELRAVRAGTPEDIDLVIVNVFNNDTDAFLTWLRKQGVRIADTPETAPPAEGSLPEGTTMTPSGVPTQPQSSDAPPAGTITPLAVPGA